MITQDMAILDFGSGRISVYIGRRGINNTISISGVGECDYAGFSDGAFFAPEQLSYVISKALSAASSSAGIEIRHLYIGVPGEFTTCVCRDVKLNLGKRKSINESDIEMLNDSGNIYADNPQYKVINVQPIYYTLDDDRRLIQPIGLKTTKLGGLLSYILAEKKFTNLVDKIMSDLGIVSFDYVSSLLAETLFLFDNNKRDQTVILIDSGYITTNIVVAKGDGILQQFNFSVGGGHISGDLAMYLETSFTQAEALKRRVILSLDTDKDDVYEVSAGREEPVSYPADIVNDIVMARLSSIAKTIEKCLKLCDYDFPDYIPYYLTGGGIAYLKGGRDYMSKVLGKSVEIVAPRLPQFNRPHLSTSLGLLNMVLSFGEVPKRKGFFAKLLNR